jgi:hypothetical protein
MPEAEGMPLDLLGNFGIILILFIVQSFPRFLAIILTMFYCWNKNIPKMSSWGQLGIHPSFIHRKQPDRNAVNSLAILISNISTWLPLVFRSFWMSKSLNFLKITFCDENCFCAPFETNRHFWHNFILSSSAIDWHHCLPDILGTAAFCALDGCRNKISRNSIKKCHCPQQFACQMGANVPMCQ